MKRMAMFCSVSNEGEEEDDDDAVMVLASCPNATDLAEALRAPGRLDFIHTLAAPGSLERQSLLEASFAARKLALDADSLQVYSQILCLKTN